MSKKKNKKKFVDDGRTIYNMNVEGFRWYDKKKRNENKIYVDKDDRNALIKAAFLSYLPIVIIILIGFTVAALLIFFWLK